MLIDFKRKWVFVHVPKAAGTSIELALKPHCDMAVEWPPELWWMERAHNIKGILLPNWDDFHSFSVARNPWEHFHSDYYFCRRVWEKRESPGGHFGDKVARVARQTFADYIRQETRELTAGGIWRYYSCGDDGQRLVKQAIRFERLAEEWPKLLRRLGLPAAPLPRANATISRKADWRRDYTPELVGLVMVACAAGIEEFGWTFE